MSAAMIRYVDDFVDTALWPRIKEFDPADLEGRFESFLQETVEAMREFDPGLPDSIADLLRLEMHLAVHPKQENFDQHFENLFTEAGNIARKARKIMENGCPDQLGLIMDENHQLLQESRFLTLGSHALVHLCGQLPRGYLAEVQIRAEIGCALHRRIVAVILIKRQFQTNKYVHQAFAFHPPALVIPRRGHRTVNGKV